MPTRTNIPWERIGYGLVAVLVGAAQGTMFLALLATGAVAEDRWPSGGSGSNDFALVGSTISNESLPLLTRMRSVAGLDNSTSGFQTYYFSSATPGGYIQAAGSSANPGTIEEPLDAGSIDDYCGKPGIVCVLDSGESFALGAAVNIDINATDCPKLDEVCTVIRSYNPEQKATVTATLQNVFLNNDVTGGGWAVIQGIHVTDTNGDAFSNTSAASGQGRMALVNTSAVITGNGADNCWTNHQAGTMLIINGSCEVASGSTGDNQGWAPNHASKSVSIGITVTSNFASTAHDAAAFNSNSATNSTMDVVAIDFFFDRASGGADADAALEINTDAGDTINVTLARGALRNGTATGECIRNVNSGSGETENLTLYQVSLTGCNNGIEQSGLAGDSNFNLVANAVTCDNVADNCIDFTDIDWIERASMTLTYLLYDSDDSTNVFHVETGGAAATEDSDDTDGFQADIDAQSPTNTMTAGSATAIESTATATEEQWSAVGGTPVWPQMNCNPARQCWKAYDSAYSIAFPFNFPAWVLGSVVTGATLNGTDGNIGR